MLPGPSDPCNYLPDAPLIIAGQTRAEGNRSNRPRGFSQWALYLDVAGVRWFGRPGAGQLAGRGDLMLIEPGTPLAYDNVTATDPSESYWVIFQPPAYWSPLLHWPRWVPGMMRFHVADAGRLEEIRLTLATLITTCHSGHPLAKIRAMHELKGLLLRCQSWIPRVPGKGVAPCLEKALGLMAQKLSEPLTVRDLAATASLSPSRFNAVFKRAFGIGPMQYLARYRMHRACTLLLGSERLIKQIGAEVGYPEIARFSTRFRKTIGASPQAYRQANK